MMSLYMNYLNVMQEFIQKFLKHSIPKLPVLTTEEGIKQIKNNLNKIENWSNIIELIPDFYLKNNMKKTGIAGIFSACLELTKEGIVKVSQERLFEKLLIKRS